MTAIYFDETNHPEMLSIPLKGKHLQEFLAGIQDDLALAEKMKVDEANGDTKEEVDLHKRAVATAHKLINTIVQGLDSQDAEKYGIDSKDIAHLIHAGTVTEKQALASFPPEVGESNLSEHTAKTLMYNFSMHLAAQEHRESDFVKLALNVQHDQIFEETKRRLNRLVDVTEDAAEVMAYSLAAMGVAQLTILEKAREKGDATAKMQEAIFYGLPTEKNKGGIREEVRNALALVYGLDASKNSERLELERIEAIAYKVAADILNVKPPPLKEGRGG